MAHDAIRELREACEILLGAAEGTDWRYRNKLKDLRKRLTENPNWPNQNPTDIAEEPL